MGAGSTQLGSLGRRSNVTRAGGGGGGGSPHLWQSVSAAACSGVKLLGPDTRAAASPWSSRNLALAVHASSSASSSANSLYSSRPCALVSTIADRGCAQKPHPRLRLPRAASTPLQ